jgi:hypothetical protein
MIDLYCERLGPGLWAEPLNAWTNLAFLLAAWMSWRLIRRSGNPPTSQIVLVALMTSIGIGSGLFHIFATPWAHVLDVAPILIFQLSFFWLYFRKVIAFTFATSTVAVGAFLIVALFSRQFSALLNRSLMYAPALILLIGLGIYHYKAQKAEPLALLSASGVFLLSLTFRTIDQATCSINPYGTHFLWHLLNAVVLYLGMRGLVLNWPHLRGHLKTPLAKAGTLTPEKASVGSLI